LLKIQQFSINQLYEQAAQKVTFIGYFLKTKVLSKSKEAYYGKGEEDDKHK